MIPPDRHQRPAIAVVRIPHISNFTDFDALMAVDGLHVYFVEKPLDLSPYSAVILPGSKNTRHDLDWLHRSGWSDRLTAFAQSGGHVLGICGGYQMMGTAVHDPHGTEGRPGTTGGLGMLPVETVLKAPKTTTLSAFTWDDLSGKGYEIHMGQTRRTGGNDLVRVVHRNQVACRDWDGCVTDDGRCMGTYMHGFFDTPAITRHWLDTIGITNAGVPEEEGFDARDKAYDLLAAHFAAHVDVAAIGRLADEKDWRLH
jgi:adenosylcobyric acid synthase